MAYWSINCCQFICPKALYCCGERMDLLLFAWYLWAQSQHQNISKQKKKKKNISWNKNSHSLSFPAWRIGPRCYLVHLSSKQLNPLIWCTFWLLKTYCSNLTCTLKVHGFQIPRLRGTLSVGLLDLPVKAGVPPTSRPCPPASDQVASRGSYLEKEKS